MRGLLFVGPGTIEARDDLPEPRIETAGDVVVEVEAAGLCGSDLHPYEGREAARVGVVPGHEAIGRVVAAGDEVRTVAVGDRVLVPFTTSCGACHACRGGLSARCSTEGRLFGWGDPDDLEVPALHGGQAERLRVPHADGTVVALDDHLDGDLDAATGVLLTDNVPTAWAAIERAELAAERSVVVVGLGAVGASAVALAHALGAGPVLAVDPVAARREVAASLGADLVVAPEGLPAALEEVAETRGRPGVDAAIEASGTDAGQAAAVGALRAGGVLSLIAVQTSRRFAFTPIDAYDRNLTVRAGRAPVRSLLPRLLPRIRSGELTVPTAALVTHPDRSLAEGPELYRRFAARDAGLVKATFRPGAGR